MRALICGAAACGSVAYASAQIKPLPASMWDEECSVQRAADVSLIEFLDDQKPRRDLALSNLNDMISELHDRDWDDETPIGEQMSAAEAARYEELSQKVQNSQLVELIEGKRERDLWAIMYMADLAKEALNREINVAEMDETQQIYVAFLASAEELMAFDDEAFAVLRKPGECNVENSLYAAAIYAYDRSSEVYGWQEAQADLTALSEKYGRPLDPSTMSAEDAERLQQDIVPVFNTFNRAPRT